MGVARKRKGTTRDRRAAPLLQGLRGIATFLNAIGPRTTRTQWSVLFRKFCEQMGLSGFRMTFDEATILRRQIHHDLAFLRWSNIELARERADAPAEAKDHRPWTDDERAFFRSDAPLDRPFEALLDRLNNLQLTMAWRCEPLAPKAKPYDPSQAILEIPWKNGAAGRWTIRSRMGTRTLQDHLYAILGQALENGTVTKLRVCRLRHCGKYLVAVRGKRREVCRGCKDAYQNQKKTDKGYWKKNRKDHWDMLVKRARTLKDSLALDRSEASIKTLQKKPGLPRYAVKQILAGQLPQKRTKPKPVVRTKPCVETPEAIAARLQPVIADYYKRMAKLDQKKLGRRVTHPPKKKR